QFGDANKVIFRAKGKERAAIDVFTDTSCPYCRKLHAEVPKLQENGITVRYVPYPRGGVRGPGYEGLRKVWCADDSAQAMTQAKRDRLAEGSTDCKRAELVDQGYRLGNRLGIKGTPTIFLPDGTRIGGYLPADQLLQRLR
ncbi:MAG TPA: DsbC family protein, partial [Gammaproteobacteria bacterium]|nr:DsbC family protein [Gammaproteobacteria bacterium]